MNYFWLEDLNENISLFMDSLRKEKYFEFFPATNGLTNEGKKINLGFSCYALKIFYITGAWENINQDRKVSWTNYINSYQKTIKNFPANSFIDDDYLNSFLNYSKKETIKNNLKKILNNTSKKNYLINEDKILNFIRAETKQSIATLAQVNKKSVKNYNYISNDFNLNSYISSLNWDYPWNAGAQFAAFCVFSKTQSIINNNEHLEFLENFIGTMCDRESGAYFRSKKPSNNELINGAMKVLTGLDWLGVDIHLPKNLIDTCLTSSIPDEGCDVVDLVYVLYRCSEATDYKKDEIIKFYKLILDKINDNYFPNVGGFSYFKESSQSHYYGVEISDSLNQPDLHGTLLFVWAISMISQHIALPTSHWKIIKP